ncbi:MAG: repeat-containing protein [Pedosphaera sp.]|nr:repeat-containing protein [Pedosphaera sp.]
MIHETKVKMAVFGPGGQRILTLGEDNAARLWNAVDGNAVGQLLKHKGAINGAMFDSQGNRILTWSDDGTARIWNVSRDEAFPLEKRILDFEVRSGTTLGSDD